MKTLSDTIIFNDLLKALDTGMAVYIKTSALEYISLSQFTYVLNEGVPTISITFYNVLNTYNVVPSEGYSVSDLYTPTNIAILEPTEVPV